MRDAGRACVLLKADVRLIAHASAPLPSRLMKTVMNLGPKETRKRFMMGILMLGAGVGIAVVLILAGSTYA